ncbi:type VI secretion system IcmF/VasK family protein [Paraburkholderia atlantica]|uniref:type VI secretion system membrane subunit TssM n=1 Tax=Paraburkholderia atlantica TaxID=2654982 RepID=UPI003D192642
MISRNRYRPALIWIAVSVAGLIWLVLPLALQPPWPVVLSLVLVTAVGTAALPAYGRSKPTHEGQHVQLGNVRELSIVLVVGPHAGALFARDGQSSTLRRNGDAVWFHVRSPGELSSVLATVMESYQRPPDAVLIPVVPDAECDDAVIRREFSRWKHEIGASLGFRAFALPCYIAIYAHLGASDAHAVEPVWFGDAINPSTMQPATATARQHMQALRIQLDQAWLDVGSPERASRAGLGYGVFDWLEDAALLSILSSLANTAPFSLHGLLLADIGHPPTRPGAWSRWLTGKTTLRPPLMMPKAQLQPLSLPALTTTVRNESFQVSKSERGRPYCAMLHAVAASAVVLMVSVGLSAWSNSSLVARVANDLEVYTHLPTARTDAKRERFESLRTHSAELARNASPSLPTGLGWGLYRDKQLQVALERVTCAAEMRELEQGLEDGINTRLQEVYEVDLRKKLYALPSEFRSVCAELNELLALVFLDSKYDDTQLNSTLRGVYFTSAAQTHEAVSADSTTLLQRLRRGLVGLFGAAPKTVSPSSGDATPTAYRGYFLRNLFQRVILAEAHLVRPNLYWEIRFRALRLVGHLLAIIVAVWLIAALVVSFGNNREYLAAIDGKTDGLAARVSSQRKALRPGAMGSILSASRELPQFDGIDLDSPGLAWRYGLYTVPAISAAAGETYDGLLKQMLLPQVTGRLETVLDTQIGAQDADGVYRTLTVYLMLFDRSHYDAKAIKAWVLGDWEHTNSVAPLGERSVMARHLDALIGEGVPAAPAKPVNAQLVRRAREFLGRNPASGRLYERAMNAMAPEAPENVTLLSAAGPQATTVFMLADGSTLARGIPGLYTYDGYHAVFNQRLPEFLERARKQDAWVMGEADASARWRQMANGNALRKDRLADDIRRQYLTDYGNYWSQFLDDVRPVSGSDGTLAPDLQTLRTLAAPDSPLARLARTAARETSLSVADGADEPSAAGSAINVITRRSQVARAASAVAATATIGQLAQRKMERELVDRRFAALREVVTGQADSGSALPGGSGVLQLGGVIGLINEQYTRLMTAGDVLATNSMPPTDDLGSTMQLEAQKLPPPFRAVLVGLASQSMRKVDRNVGSLLTMQVESSVGAQCRRAVEGKYPFVASVQEVDIDDFNRVFAAGGLLDDFFHKTLASRVDTSIRPWRYKPVSPGMPPMQGPSLDPFERAAAIRQTFFRDPSATRMSWNAGLKVVSLDPEITDLLIDVDGQNLRYAHGPVATFPITWPGPRGGSMAGLTANPRVRPDTSTVMTAGPWALFRLIDRGRVTSTLSSSRSAVDFNFDDRHAVIELTSGGQSGPQLTALLRGFRCPGSGSALATRAEASSGSASADEL